jgi:hypothetical protein
MSAANFEQLAGTVALGRDATGALVVGAGNPIVRRTLEERFRQHIAWALYDVAGCRVGVVLVDRPVA